VTENDVFYEGVGIPEMLAWGPAALTVAQDGSFWIADTAGSRLLRYNSLGESLSTLDLEGMVVGVTDVAVPDRSIFILDGAALPAKVLQFDKEGTLVQKHDLPDGLRLENGLTGISLGDSGEVLVEREGGAYVTQFLDAHGESIELITTNGYLHHGNLFKTQISGLTSDSSNSGTIFAGSNQIEIETENNLGGIRFLGFGLKDDFFVILEELMMDPASGLQVDQTIRHYNASGELLGLARAPIADQYTYVEQGLAVGQDGSVYFLATRSDRIEVLKLHFTSKLDSILTKSRPTFDQSERSSTDSEINCSIYRNTIISNANAYLNNYKYLSSINIDQDKIYCSNREKPSYLGGADYYSSVPYDWGGDDTVSTFNSKMSSGKQAGNTDTTVKLSCSFGVDCAGFVFRTWGLSNHGTCGFFDEELTEGITQDQLKKGDVVVKCNSHAVLYISTGSAGINNVESTQLNNYDRVLYRYSFWSRFSGYSFRSYRELCD